MKWVLILLVLITACKKAEDRKCWKFHGDQIEKRVELEGFKTLEINPYVIVNLVQDTINFCKLSGGENVVNLIKTDVSNGILVLKNENKCSFLRSAKKKITAEIHFVSMGNIIYQGSENVKTIGPITLQNFAVNLKETSGTLDLELNTINLSVTAEPSFANFILKGYTKTAILGVKGNAYCDTRDLLVQDKIVINSRSVGDCYINGSTAHLKCETNGSGNVYYTNTPGWIEWNDYATGKLLQAP